MLKSYDELRKVDVVPFCDKRDGMLFLNWAKCIDLLHIHGAETAYFVPVTNPVNGSSLIMSETHFTDSKEVVNRCYETKIEIHIDDKVYVMQSPVMNGSNPVRDNSMSQQRVWNSMCRSFVKGVAIYTGLGFDLWLKEEVERDKTATADVHHDILKVRDRVLETVTALQKKGMTLEDIAKALNRTEEELKSYMNYYNVLNAIENNLLYILKNYDKQ